MKVNIEAVNELINKEFRNNRAFFADTININRSYLTDILNGKKSSSSPKFCNSIILFCENRNIDYDKYIFF